MASRVRPSPVTPSRATVKQDNSKGKPATVHKALVKRGRAKRAKVNRVTLNRAKVRLVTVRMRDLPERARKTARPVKQVIKETLAMQGQLARPRVLLQRSRRPAPLMSFVRKDHWHRGQALNPVRRIFSKGKARKRLRRHHPQRTTRLSFFSV